MGRNSRFEFQIFLNLEFLGILDLLLGYYKNAQFEN